jgi:hypothetical protein
MTGQMDGWKVSFHPQRPLIYVMVELMVHDTMVKNMDSILDMVI